MENPFSSLFNHIDMNQFLVQVIIAFGMIYSIVLHEIGHGFAAFLCGDTTARDEGRLSLNPVSHIDLVGSVLVPLASYFIFHGGIFGWAKPVPVDVSNFKNRRIGDIIVSLAGVFLNLILMILFLTIYALSGGNPIIQASAGRLAVINFGLFYLNLIPLPPLDGYHVLRDLVPETIGSKWDYWVNGRSFAFLLILVMIFNSPIGDIIFYPSGPIFQFIAQNYLSLFHFGGNS